MFEDHKFQCIQPEDIVSFIGDETLDMYKQNVSPINFNLDETRIAALSNKNEGDNIYYRNLINLSGRNP